MGLNLVFLNLFAPMPDTGACPGGGGDGGGRRPLFEMLTYNF